MKLSSSALQCGRSGSLESKWADVGKINLRDVHFSLLHASFWTVLSHPAEVNLAGGTIRQLSSARNCSAWDACQPHGLRERDGTESKVLGNPGSKKGGLGTV